MISINFPNGNIGTHNRFKIYLKQKRADTVRSITIQNITNYHVFKKQSISQVIGANIKTSKAICSLYSEQNLI